MSSFCYSQSHSPPTFVKTGKCIEQSTGKKKTSAVHICANALDKNTLRLPNKKEVGSGGQAGGDGGVD